MSTAEKYRPFAPAALISVAAMWGLAFVVMVDPIKRQGINDFLSFRFLFAVLLLIILRPKVLRAITGEMLLKGGAAGLFLGSGYIFQTLGPSLQTNLWH